MSNAYERSGQGRRWGRRQTRPLPVLIGAVVVAIIGVLIYRASAPGETQVRVAADATAQQLGRTPVQGLSVTLGDVDKALQDGTRDSGGRSASGINVRAAGSDDRGDRFEFTNRKGQHPVCLTVSLPALGGGPAYPVTTIDDGPCP